LAKLCIVFLPGQTKRPPALSRFARGLYISIDLITKNLFLKEEVSIIKNHLSSSRNASAGIGTVIRPKYKSPLICPGLNGCRGFTGPVPPPLWIRVSSPIQLQANTITFLKICQMRSGEKAKSHLVDRWLSAVGGVKEKRGGSSFLPFISFP
jgi:hypothetical protein